MSARAQYSVHLDLDNDRAFTSSNEDVSAYVKAGLTWQLGAVEAFTDIARTSTLQVVLNNTSQRFSPEHANALTGFRPGALIRVRTVYASTTRQHFIGWINPDGIQVKPGSRGTRETIVQASGFFSQLMDAPVRIPLQEGKRADEIITAMLTRTSIYPPGLLGWFLGQAGLSNLGQSTVLGSGVSDYASLEAGINVFNYVGDTWNERTNIFQALRELMMAERGFLYENRDGKVVFFSRHHWHQDLSNAVDATLTGSDIDRRRSLDYRYGNVLNRRVIKLHPRKVGTVLEVVGRANSAPRVPVGGQLEVRVAFDDQGNRIGAREVVAPVVATDWTANTQDDGLGSDLAAYVTVSMTADASGAKLIFTNSANHVAYILNLQIRGIKISDYGEIEVSHQDDTSIGENTLRAETLYAGLLDDVAVASDLARWDVMVRKDPDGQIQSISRRANRDGAAMTYALARTIGDRIAISENQTGHSREYFIVGERHEVGTNFEHLVTHYLRPAPPATAWILGRAGFSNLGQNTYLAA